MSVVKLQNPKLLLRLITTNADNAMNLSELEESRKRMQASHDCIFLTPDWLRKWHDHKITFDTDVTALNLNCLSEVVLY